MSSVAHIRYSSGIHLPHPSPETATRRGSPTSVCTPGSCSEHRPDIEWRANAPISTLASRGHCQTAPSTE